VICLVVGCADKLEGSTSVTHSTWYSVRSEDSLTVYCNHSSGAVYHLRCHNSQWTGDLINCTEPSSNPGTFIASHLQPSCVFYTRYVYRVGKNCIIFTARCYAERGDATVRRPSVCLWRSGMFFTQVGILRK